MSYKIKTLQEHLNPDSKPKRLLVLDADGLRGILSIAILEKIEEVLKA